MSELIDNTERRKALLKHLMLQLHSGESVEAVRKQLARLMGQVSYDQVVEVEEELIADGLPATEILKFCDVHTEVLKGQLTEGDKKRVPRGHPVHTFREENRALTWQIEQLQGHFERLEQTPSAEEVSDLVEQIDMRFRELTDLEKHYLRKENLLFPFLEKHGVTGPPKVMWGKDDEVRDLLSGSIEALGAASEASLEELQGMIEILFEPTVNAIGDMIYREEQILFPMSLDLLSEGEWYAIWKQSPEIGFCLYDPEDVWEPESAIEKEDQTGEGERIQLPSGSLLPEELDAILNNIPFDLTFVDKNDRVRYFTRGRERIFTRTRAILGRKVQMCHPPSSVHIVEQILHDFHSGKENRAPFWINLKGKFIHIEYFALRGKDGEYLGTLEVSQDLTSKRALEGEQRLLSYDKEEA